MANLAKIEELNGELASLTDLSPSLSVVNLLKFAKQSFYNGDEQYYAMPSSNELSFIYKYIDQAGKSNSVGQIKTFIDSAKQSTRISYRVKDVGTLRMEDLISNIKAKTDTIFPADKYTVHVTGGSVVFLKGTEYLIINLFQSLGLAVILISLFMAMLFNSRKMVLLSLVPNIIPLLFTAGIMGYFSIPIKASTILVFSIAFGISVDNTIHFLTKYRQELKLTAWSISDSVQLALRETGISMIYTSSVLFFGFGIFSFSSFGGTVALGILVSLTLLVALISNLILLPSLLMWLQRRATTKYFQEPLIEIFDEEVDIEFDNLVIETSSSTENNKVKPIEK
jgi:predicted RND superfamily exporter protein